MGLSSADLPLHVVIVALIVGCTACARVIDSPVTSPGPDVPVDVGLTEVVGDVSDTVNGDGDGSGLEAGRSDTGIEVVDCPNGCLQGNVCLPVGSSLADACQICGPNGLPLTCPLGCSNGVCSKATAISIGDEHSCAITSAKEVWCWGDNSHGQTYGVNKSLGGINATEPHRMDRAGLPATPLPPVSAVATGARHTAVLTEQGDLWLFSSALQPLKSDGTLSNPAPFKEESLGPVSYLFGSSGGNNICVVPDDSTADIVLCWHDVINPEAAPDDASLNRVIIDDLKGSEVHVGVTGAAGACVIRGPLREVWCWGYNYGELLSKTGQSSPTTPVKIHLIGPAESIQITGYGGAALNADGALFLWGQVAPVLNPNPSALRTQKVDSYSFATTSAPGDHFCGVTGQQSLLCWGNNDYGQAGRGLATPFLGQPTSVPSVGAVQAVGVGQRHSCALTSTGLVYCFGRAHKGELGTATTSVTAFPLPQLVSEPP